MNRDIDYAIRVLIYLTQHEGKGTVSAADLSETMAIPLRAIPGILRQLVEKNLLINVGPNEEGFQLARLPEAMSLLDIVSAFDPAAATLKLALDPDTSENTAFGVVHDELSRIQAMVIGEMALLSLRALAWKYATGNKIELREMERLPLVLPDAPPSPGRTPENSSRPVPEGRLNIARHF